MSLFFKRSANTKIRGSLYCEPFSSNLRCWLLEILLFEKKFVSFNWNTLILIFKSEGYVKSPVYCSFIFGIYLFC